MSFQLTKRKTFYAFHESGQSFAIPLREETDPAVAVKWEPELHVPLKQQAAPFALEISLSQS
ncbi:MAG: hypothetical protein NW208_08475 [Bryobacter sp.]|nr:hypothetical protein [Bryobacter sp.]